METQKWIPKRAAHEAVRIKLKIQWNYQKAGEARIALCPRKATGSNKSHRKQETMKVTAVNKVEGRLLKQFGVHIYVLSIGHVGT